MTSPDPLSVLCCPDCSGSLKQGTAGTLTCDSCKNTFSCDEGIYALLPKGLSLKEEYQQDYFDKVYSRQDTTKVYDDGLVDNFFFGMLNDTYFFSRLNALMKQGGTMLDFGCGGGNISRHLHAHPNAVLFNLDISKNALRHAKKYRKEAEEYVQATNFRLPFKSGSLDYICTYGVLHHLEDISPVLAEIRRILKPGGSFLAFEPVQRYPWAHLWMDILYLPKGLRERIARAYAKAQQRFHKNDPVHAISSTFHEPEKIADQHFYKNLVEYTALLGNEFGPEMIKITPALVEFLPPRFYFIRSRIWVRAYIGLSRLLTMNRRVAAHARFVMMEARKPRA